MFEDWSECDLSSESDSVIDEVVTKISTAKVQMVSREWHFYSKSTRSSQRYCYDRLKKLRRKQLWPTTFYIKTNFIIIR